MMVIVSSLLVRSGNLNKDADGQFDIESLPHTVTAVAQHPAKAKVGFKSDAPVKRHEDNRGHFRDLLGRCIQAVEVCRLGWRAKILNGLRR